MLEQLRERIRQIKRMEASGHTGLAPALELYEGLEAEMAELQAENERLRKGIRAVLDGDARTTLKTELCAHDRYGYEDCENCIDEFLTVLVAPPTEGERQ